MSVLEHITPGLLAGLENQFDKVELTIQSSTHVRLKVKMPPDLKRGSDKRKALAEAYGRLLREAGLCWVDSPAELEGHTGIVISALLEVVS